jgi:hypothetical protein
VLPQCVEYYCARDHFSTSINGTQQLQGTTGPSWLLSFSLATPSNTRLLY